MNQFTAELQHKVILISGAATYIGQVLAQYLVDLGARVIIADINQQQGQAVAAQVGAQFRVLDLMDDASIQTLAASLEQLDILINLACLYADHGAKSSRKDWLDSFNVNVFGHAALSQACRPLLQQSTDGAIIHISSISAGIAQKQRWVYPASKASLEQLTRNMALDFAPDPIRVHALALGWTWSAPMQALSGDDRMKTDRIAGRFHLRGRINDAEEVAQALSLLCSPRARLLSGSVIHADGGYHILGPEATDSAIEELSQ